MKTMHEQELSKALEFIKSRHNGEIPYKFGSMECAKLMIYYASQYRESGKPERTKEKIRKEIQCQIDKAEIDRLKKLVLDITAHDAALCACLKEIENVIFIEMPGQNLDMMGEKYYNKIKGIINQAIRK